MTDKLPIRIGGGISVGFVGLDPLFAGLSMLPARARAAEKRALWASVLDIKRHVQMKYDNRVLRRRSTPGLFGSVITEVTMRGNEQIGIVGTPLIYAKTHEFGATIRPKRAKALFVPLSERARKLSGDLKTLHTYRAWGRMARAVAFEDRGLEWGVDFVLAKRVRIPKRPVWEPTFSERRNAVFEYFRKAMVDEIAKGGIWGARTQS